MEILHKDEKVVGAMNFHSYGDLWIQPYNYLKDKTDAKLRKDKNTHFLYEAFQEFNHAAYHPQGSRYLFF